MYTGLVQKVLSQTQKAEPLLKIFAVATHNHILKN